MAEPTPFDRYFREVHEAIGLTDRERQFIGLAVTLTKTCEP